jgi:hypothetical protein
MSVEKSLIEKFQKIMRISNRIKQSQVAEMMGIDQSTLTQKLFEWGDILPFKIESDEIVIQDMNHFITQMDNLFEEWNLNEKTGQNQKLPFFMSPESIEKRNKRKKKNQKPLKIESKMDKRMNKVEADRISYEKKKNLPYKKPVYLSTYEIKKPYSKIKMFFIDYKGAIFIAIIIIGLMILVR